MLALFFKLRATDAPAPDAPSAPTAHEVTQPSLPVAPDPGPTQ